MTQDWKRVRVAVPVPVADGFDYRWPGPGAPPLPGTRVRVPFGRGERIGIVIEARGASPVADSALKNVREVLDPEPLIDGELLRSLEWAAGYYHHPIGDVLAQALPGLLRRGRPSEAPAEPAFRLTAAGSGVDRAALNVRAPRQAAALALLAASPGLTGEVLREAGVTTDTLRRLQQRAWIEAVPGHHGNTQESLALPRESPPPLTAEQHAAVETLRAAEGFVPALLQGVTGSGKTEVFLQLIGDALARGRQSLLLVPEIGLTPQLVGRLEKRFGSALAVFHSGLAPGERLRGWREARAGRVGLVVGTRSAVFAPLPRAGLIVVDEEHDPSYKQQSGFRYSARDLAIMRARALDVPVVLASATPSLESFRNAAEGRYRSLRLPQRIGAGGEPDLRVIDLNQHASRRGLSTPLIAAMEQHLGRGHQVLLFINRRGFAPVLFCANCGEAAECDRCDARMTVHARKGRLLCHHCGRQQALHWACPTCGGERIAVGAGTERVTAEIEALFPEHEIARLDRDVIVGRDALGQALDDIESGRSRIIVGTQLLTKGHDFPFVTLVGVLNADQGLFGADFRSEERLAQTIIQVAGRAGRRERQGEVLIQTHYPKHPLLRQLLAGDYSSIALHALAERRAAGWPPYSHLAVFRAEARDRSRVFDLLERLKRHCGADTTELRVLGPTPEWMERREGRYRAQLVLQGTQRPPLHALLDSCVTALDQWPEARRLRWSLDVDPVEL
jgi:primosomal protein N' (replication factor Y)